MACQKARRSVCLTSRERVDHIGSQLRTCIDAHVSVIYIYIYIYIYIIIYIQLVGKCSVLLYPLHEPAGGTVKPSPVMKEAVALFFGFLLYAF